MIEGGGILRKATFYYFNTHLLINTTVHGLKCMKILDDDGRRCGILGILGQYLNAKKKEGCVI
jgi:hypothetical protein